MEANHPDIERVLIGKDELAARVAKMGADITRDYADKVDEGIVVVSVLRGAAIFMADLVRQIDLPLEMDYLALSSYGAGAKSSGVVSLRKDLDGDIEGKHVIIAEDIVDSGLTLEYTIELLEGRNPASVEVAALFYKIREDGSGYRPRYCGFDVPDEFVVGYGLDYAECYRNLPYVGVLKREVYEPNALAE